MMWTSKWIISDLLYQTDTIQRVLQKISIYSINNEIVNVTILETIYQNISYINIETLAVILVGAICFCFSDKEKFPYLLIGLIPFIWIILVKNHSYIHARFTFRNLLISIFSLSIIILDSIKSLSSKKSYENYGI